MREEHIESAALDFLDSSPGLREESQADYLVSVVRIFLARPLTTTSTNRSDERKLTRWLAGCSSRGAAGTLPAAILVFCSMLV